MKLKILALVAVLALWSPCEAGHRGQSCSCRTHTHCRVVHHRRCQCGCGPTVAPPIAPQGQPSAIPAKTAFYGEPMPLTIRVECIGNCR